MSDHRLRSILIDPQSLGAATPDQAHEREIAVFDILEENRFEPEGAEAGPYDLRLSNVDGRLCFEITGPDFERRHLLSLTPIKSVMKDYFLICDSYYAAIRGATAQQIEALDMGRRGLHNEGSDRLRERLEGKVALDHSTARRLFTLVCALHRRP